MILTQYRYQRLAYRSAGARAFRQTFIAEAINMRQNRIRIRTVVKKMIGQRARPACAPSRGPQQAWFWFDGVGALPREQMPFEATRLAGGLERKRQDLWNGS